VRLEPEVWESMRGFAEAKGIPLDRQVNEALREWLKRGKRQ
jgi:hypothetical protein